MLLRPSLAIAGLTVLLGGLAHATPPTPEAKCLGERLKARGKYEACVQKFLTVIVEKNFDDAYAMAKCRQKYARVWAKLQMLEGTSCVSNRYVDNGDGTISDRFSGLQWEKKDDLAGVHDKDNLYTWSTNGDGNRVDADGTVFTSFLAGLNAPTCFAGQCDWRLPTISELSSIVLPDTFPCQVTPCIDPIFGPTQAGGLDDYWTMTSDAEVPEGAWQTRFSTGDNPDIFKDQTGYVRAVRSER
jgi:hypothetical protein